MLYKKIQNYKGVGWGMMLGSIVSLVLCMLPGSLNWKLAFLGTIIVQIGFGLVCFFFVGYYTTLYLLDEYEHEGDDDEPKNGVLLKLLPGSKKEDQGDKKPPDPKKPK